VPGYGCSMASHPYCYTIMTATIAWSGDNSLSENAWDKSHRAKLHATTAVYAERV